MAGAEWSFRCDRGRDADKRGGRALLERRRSGGAFRDHDAGRMDYRMAQIETISGAGDLRGTDEGKGHPKRLPCDRDPSRRSLIRKRWREARGRKQKTRSPVPTHGLVLGVQGQTRESRSSLGRPTRLQA